MAQDSRGNIKEEVLKAKLNEETGEGKTEVSDIGEEFEVFFVDSNRYYTVDKDGNIIEEGKIVVDKSPGDITKDENGNDIEEGQPYEIWCIEDLVAFSNMVNGSGIIIENGKAIEVNKSTNFSNKTVELKTNLNFKSKYSYADSERTDFGNINGNESDGNTLINEMSTGTGFKPIGISYSKFFEGTFKGNNKSIKNIFQNGKTQLGLFTIVRNATIQDIVLTGNINSTNYTVGGICGSAENTKIINCKNKANIIEQGKINGNNSYIGGIVGIAKNTDIINCSNEEDINGDAQTGGIVGNASGNIINCYNIGDITGGIGGNYGAVGGIVGVGSSPSLSIYNCFNTGEITSNATGVYTSAGGILGNSGQNGTVNTIVNAYNIGKINEAYRGRGGIVGGLWYHNPANTATLKNTYYQEDGELLGYGEFASAQGIEKQNKDYMHSEKLVMNLNNYIKNNEDKIDTSQWKDWKLGENGYPTFE